MIIRGIVRSDYDFTLPQTKGRALKQRMPNSTTRSRRRKITAAKVFGAVMLMWLLVELGLRLAGAGDFALYDIDASFGYVMKPSQSGLFFNSRRWTYNEHSISSARPWQPGNDCVLMVGNSIVVGGHPYDHEDTLGPLTEKRLGQGRTVWPIGAGGWTTVNMLSYLERHEDVAVGCPQFVWIVLAGGFMNSAPWFGDHVQPRD